MWATRNPLQGDLWPISLWTSKKFGLRSLSVRFRDFLARRHGNDSALRKNAARISSVTWQLLKSRWNAGNWFN